MLEKTYRPHDIETKFERIWREMGAFRCTPDGDAQPYTIMMPPPNVTGSLHMGHALTFTLQDALIRHKRMDGFDALWQPGTDHAGIATQSVVERKLAGQGIAPETLSRNAFLDEVWKFKAESGGVIQKQLTQLGASADWSRERFTMDEGLSHAVRSAFVQLHRDGLIYRDQRLVNWDPELRTAISDLEVDQKEVDGHLWHFRYPVEGEPGTYLTVATTRPETMLGDTGVAVHPEDERYRHLVGKHVVLPLVGRRIPIAADTWADPEVGSGAVKITPAHDFNDFEVGRRRGLDVVNILNADASLNANVPERYQGLDRYEARRQVVADLEADGLVAATQAHRHTVPHGDRSGVAIEPWLLDQWYTDAPTLAKPAIEAVQSGRTRFVPAEWEKTYLHWMENIQPWCISRQIAWGHPIPAWFGPNGTVFVEMDSDAAQAAAAEHFGLPAETLGVDDVPTAEQTRRADAGELVLLRRDSDVLDTWFSSALWPFSTLGWPAQTPELARYYPTDVLVTAFDIIFFWVARMMMMGLYFQRDVPFKDVYIHALVRDAFGQKMSKSKGNIMDPLDLIGEYGADALRFTLIALSAQGRDVKLSRERVEGYRNFATKLWNAARFCQMYEVAADPAFDPGAVRSAVNRWIVAKTVRAVRAVDAGFDGYHFNDAASAIYQFTWHQFCDWYIEFAKPLLSGDDADAAAETRATAAWVMQHILHVLHPFMPFITEELWEHFGGGDGNRLVTGRWPRPADAWIDADREAEIDWLTQVIGDIRAVRGEMNVPNKTAVRVVVPEAGEQTRERLTRHAELISRMARLAGIEPSADAPSERGAQFIIDGATAHMPLEGIVDVAREQERLRKEVAKLDGDLERFDAKLANEKFLEKAPAEVVADHRDRRAQTAEARDKLAAALARLGG